MVRGWELLMSGWGGKEKSNVGTGWDPGEVFESSMGMGIN